MASEPRKGFPLKNLLAGIALTGGLVYGLSPQPQGLNVYYGLLHSHTLISDGSGTPEEAFKLAKNADLDFFAVTEHNHPQAESGAKDRRDGVLIATNSLLYNGAGKQNVVRQKNGQEETVLITPLIEAAKATSNASFVALYGQEFSTISSGNHINVLGIDEVITVTNGDFNGLVKHLQSLQRAGRRSPLLQLNHPDIAMDLFYNGSNPSTVKNMFNDYGIDAGDLGPDFKDMVQALDPYVELIEVLSGPAMKEDRIENYRYSQNENDYYFYLKQGFHLSPSAGQDNHYETWGNVTDARVGVLADKLTEESIYAAIRNHQTFVTEDKNLQVTLYVNGQIIGSSIKAVEETELKINVDIKDSDDPDPTYTIMVYGGEILPELSTKAKNWKASDGKLEEIEVTGNGVFTIPGVFASSKPNFIYVKVIQNDDDRAWTSPVWINDINASVVAGVNSLLTVVYYWTKTTSSKIYHKEGCSSINQIKPENLASGIAPPSGRSRHNCNIIENEEH